MSDKDITTKSDFYEWLDTYPSDVIKWEVVDVHEDCLWRECHSPRIHIPRGLRPIALFLRQISDMGGEAIMKDIALKDFYESGHLPQQRNQGKGSSM